MRRLILILFALISLLALTTGAAPAGDEPEQTEAEMSKAEKGMALLTKAVELTGGLDNYRKIVSVSIKADLIVDRGRGAYSMQLEMVDAYPDKRRNVIYMEGQPIFDIRDGDGGWKTGSTGEIEPMTDEDVAANNKDLMRSTLYLFRHSDNLPFEVVYEGQAMVNGSKLDYVALMNADGTPLCSLGFGPDGMLRSKTYWGMSAMGPGTTEEVYSDMTEVDGIIVPMTIKKTINGMDAGTTHITEFAVNPDLPADTFSKPSE